MMRTARRRAVVPALLLAAASAAAGPMTAAEAIRHYNEVSDYPIPVPESAALRAIDDGKVVVLHGAFPRGDGDDTAAIVGFRKVAQPMIRVWVEKMAAGGEDPDAFTSLTVSGDRAGSAVRYQHIDLPWPFRDRHWVIHARKMPGLAEASDGRIWEHRWSLLPDGAARIDHLAAAGRSARSAADAVYLPQNSGAWTMIDLGDRATLVAAHASVRLGGFIPDRWARGYASRHLQGMLGALGGEGALPLPCVTDDPVYAGDGRPLTAEMLASAAPADGGSLPVTQSVPE